MYDNSYNFYSNFRPISQEENLMRIKQKSKNNRSINKPVKIGMPSENNIDKSFNVFTGDRNLSEHLLQYYN